MRTLISTLAILTPILGYQVAQAGGVIIPEPVEPTDPCSTDVAPEPNIDFEPSASVQPLEDVITPETEDPVVCGGSATSPSFGVATAGNRTVAQFMPGISDDSSGRASLQNWDVWIEANDSEFGEGTDLEGTASSFMIGAEKATESSFLGFFLQSLSSSQPTGNDETARDVLSLGAYTARNLGNGLALDAALSIDSHSATVSGADESSTGYSAALGVATVLTAGEQFYVPRLSYTAMDSNALSGEDDTAKSEVYGPSLSLHVGHRMPESWELYADANLSEITQVFTDTAAASQEYELSTQSLTLGVRGALSDTIGLNISVIYTEADVTDVTNASSFSTSGTDLRIGISFDL